MRSQSPMSVMVPTVDRGEPNRRFWSTITTADRFAIRSASGRPYDGRKVCANALNVALICRCASAAMVSNTSEDLPDPDTPANTTNSPLGRSRSIPFRLFSRAPRTVMVERASVTQALLPEAHS